MGFSMTYINHPAIGVPRWKSPWKTGQSGRSWRHHLRRMRGGDRPMGRLTRFFRTESTGEIFGWLKFTMNIGKSMVNSPKNMVNMSILVIYVHIWRIPPKYGKSMVNLPWLTPIFYHVLPWQFGGFHDWHFGGDWILNETSNTGI